MNTSCNHEVMEAIEEKPRLFVVGAWLRTQR